MMSNYMDQQVVGNLVAKVGLDVAPSFLWALFTAPIRPFFVWDGGQML
jgi:hypothetical protein